MQKSYYGDDDHEDHDDHEMMINMKKDLLRTFVQPTAWRKNRDYVLYYHNWSWTVVTGANLKFSVMLFVTINQSKSISKHPHKYCSSFRHFDT